MANYSNGLFLFISLAALTGVKVSLNITSFTINGRQSYEVWSNTEISMTCTTTGYPMPMLSIVYNHEKKKKLNSVTAFEINYTSRATCQSMGEYICLAENKNQQKDNKSVNLRVICAPEYRPRKEETPKFGIYMGSNKTVKLCVIGYPAPTEFTLSKGSFREVASQEYRVNFTYTDETSGRGEITVTILSVGPQDFGRYQLNSEGWTSGNHRFGSFLKFELLAPATPSCPKNLTVSATFPDSITLSWKPGFDGGLQQSFTILRYGSGSTVESQPILEPAGSLEDEMSYTVTGLCGSTTYTFGLRAENEEGVANCTMQVHGSIIASPLSSSDHSPNNLTLIVVIAVLVLVLVITVVAFVFVLVGRRRSRGVALYTDTVLTPTRLVRSSSRDDVRVAYETIDDTALTEDVPDTGTVHTPTSNGLPSNRSDDQNAYETPNGGWLKGEEKQKHDVQEGNNEEAVYLNAQNPESYNTVDLADQGVVNANAVVENNIGDGNTRVKECVGASNYDCLTLTEDAFDDDGTYTKIKVDKVPAGHPQSEDVNVFEKSLYIDVI